MPDRSIFYQDATKASYLVCPDGEQITVHSLGGTLYYKTTADVTSDDSDGSIESAASAALTAPVWAITAQGAMTQLLVETDAA